MESIDEFPGNSVSWFTSVRGEPADRISRKFTPGVHPKHKKWVSITDISDVFQFSDESMSEFPGNSVSWITSNRGESIDTKSQNPDFGFPEGRLHPTDRAGIAKCRTFWRKMSMFPNFKIWKLKSCNMSGNSFHISKSPDIEKIQIFQKYNHLYNKLLSIPKIC